jgi:hypothetical protein
MMPAYFFNLNKILIQHELSTYQAVSFILFDKNNKAKVNAMFVWMVSLIGSLYIAILTENLE